MGAKFVKRESEASWSLSDAADFLIQRIDERLGERRLPEYYTDPVRFVREVIKTEPTREQIEILTSLVNHNHVAVRSGHGIGKTSCLAFAILWFLTTRMFAKIPVTAPTSHQLEDILWGELVKWWRNMEPSFRDQWDYTSDKFFHKQHPNEWYCVARTARKERPEALQGFHGENLFFVLEESGGIPDELFQVSEGAITAKGNLVLAVGNPTRLSGFFHDCFHRDRAQWNTLHFSSLGSSLVDPAYPKRMSSKYGEASNIYRIRVLGEFPFSEEDQLIPLSMLEAAVARTDVEQEGQIVWGVDVARFGSDETVLAKRSGNRITEIKAVRGYDTMKTTGWIVNEVRESKDKPSIIFVDSIGYGAGVADRLRELRLNVCDIQVSESPSQKEKFANLRAELWFEFRDWLEKGAGSIPNDEDLLAQASAVKYSYHSSGKLIIEKKEDLKKRGLPSPDRADAVCLTFAKDNRLFPFL